MLTSQNILVPTDLSAASGLALDAAAVLARTFKARVTLLHVLDPLAIPPPGIVPDLSAARQLEENVADRMRSAIERHFAGVTTVDTALLIDASAAHAICKFATQINADMIVIATHGRTGLAHMLIGSVAEKVVRHAPCPVLSMRTRVSE
jgi:nucleotide-binding universal stress UspA family protein